MSGTASSNIEVRIGFDKSALAGIPAARKEIETLERGTRRASAGLQTLDAGRRTEKLAKGMRGVAEESLRAFVNMGRIMGPLEVITGAASIAGLARLSSEWAGVTTQLGYSAQRAGVGISQLNALQGAATLTGVSTQALTAGLTSLNDNLTNAATGRAPQAVAAFNYLHVALRDANGQLRSSTSVLPELADALSHIKNPAIQAQLATTLLGGSAEELLPLLRQGAAGMANLTHEAQQYGVKTDRDLKISKTFTHQQGELTLATQGLANTLAEKYLPGLGNAEDALAHFISTNKSAISDGIGAMTVALTGFSAYLSGKFLKFVGKSLLGDLPDILKSAVGDTIRLLDGPAIAAGILLDPNTSIQNQKDEEAALRAAIERMNVARARQGLPPLPMPMVQPASLSQAAYETDHQENLKRPPGGPLMDRFLPKDAQRLLYNIGQGESGGDYSRSYGTLPDFKGFAAHPDVESTGPDGRPTSAAGRYQFEYGTWQETAKALGLSDFSPPNQDRAAWSLAQQRYAAQTGRDLLTDLQQHDPKVDAGIKQALAATWPSITKDNLETTAPQPPLSELSLPDARGLAGRQGHRNAGADVVPTGAAGKDSHDGKYQSAISGDWLPLDPQPSAPAANVGDGTGRGSAAASETTVKGSATVTVKLDGAPPGTRTSASSDGDLFASSGPVRVETSAVGQGMKP